MVEVEKRENASKMHFFVGYWKRPNSPIDSIPFFLTNYILRQTESKTEEYIMLKEDNSNAYTGFLYFKLKMIMISSVLSRARLPRYIMTN